MHVPIMERAIPPKTCKCTGQHISAREQIDSSRLTTCVFQPDCTMAALLPYILTVPKKEQKRKKNVRHPHRRNSFQAPRKDQLTYIVAYAKN